VRLITLVGLVSKNGNLDRRGLQNHLQETGRSKLAAVIEAGPAVTPHILMTTAAMWLATSRLFWRLGLSGSPNSIGIMLVSGMIIGTGVHPVCRPSIYMLVARKHVAEAADEVERGGLLPEAA